MNCRVCGDPLDPEHPDSTYDVNPETNRMAWMHHWCWSDAVELLIGKRSKHPLKYLDQHDEYWTKRKEKV